MDSASRERYRAVIFDLFGTLVEFSIQAYDALLAAMAATLAVPTEEFTVRWMASYHLHERGELATVETAIAHTLSDWMAASEKRHRAAAALWVDFQRGLLVPRGDAAATLRELRGRGVPVGVLSNCPAEVAVLWHESPLAALVDAAVFSCTAGRMKPDPELYRLLCGRLNAQPHDCLYIGDGGSRELSGASATGMTALLLRVPDEDPLNAIRLGREPWSGASVTRLMDVLPMLHQQTVG